MTHDKKKNGKDVRDHSVQSEWCRVRQGEGAKDHKALGSGKAPQVVIKRNPYDGGKLFRIGTWNVRTTLRAGKLENCKREMARAVLY